MNLFTPAGGLFATHVTWADVEEDMQRELDTVASFGPNKTAKDIGDGKGFMSKIVLIEPDWQHKDKELPERFIVKILTQLAMQKITTEISAHNKVENVFNEPTFMANVEQLQKRCHNAEVTVYNHLAKIPAGKIDIPKMFFMKKFSENNPVKGYMIMEFLENIKGVHIFENVKPKQVRQVLRNKAVIEANSLSFTDDERKVFTNSPFSELFGTIFKGEMLDRFIDVLRAFESGKLAEKADHLGAILSDLLDFERADHMAEECEMGKVLCHGDLWSMNVLWRPDEDGELNLAAVIDYQTAHFGCAATDLVRLFAACLSGEDRREHWEELLEDFYGYLKEEVAEKEMPYTLEQLKEAYKRFLPIGGFLIVPAIGPLFEVILKTTDEEYKKKCLETVMEKLECLLDDMFFYHDRNMKIRGEHRA